MGYFLSLYVEIPPSGGISQIPIRELIDIDGEDALKTDLAGFGLISNSSPQ